jgi:hypothetical protein
MPGVHCGLGSVAVGSRWAAERPGRHGRALNALARVPPKPTDALLGWANRDHPASLSRSGSLTAAQDLIGYMVEPKNGLKAPP